MHKDENSLPGAGTKLVGGVDQDGTGVITGLLLRLIPVPMKKKVAPLEEKKLETE